MDIARNPRLQGQADAQAVSFTASVHFDWRLLPYDVQGSIAHVTMLTEQGVIPALARDQIVEGLQRVRDEWMQGTLMPRQEWEDVHMNVEGRLLELIGPVAGMVHTGRSRNDQVATDMHLYMKAVGQQFQRQLRELMQTIVRRAEEHIDVIIPGYTHLQAAQPVLL
ncbi:MAG: lyase family protein, partial [Firmicutes bacterium]|nr:lyase family protein [Bacillota bacterium]